MVVWDGPGSSAVAVRIAAVAGTYGASGRSRHRAEGMSADAPVMRPSPPPGRPITPSSPSLSLPLPTTTHGNSTCSPDDVVTIPSWACPLVARGLLAASADRPTGRIEGGQLRAAAGFNWECGYSPRQRLVAPALGGPAGRGRRPAPRTSPTARTTGTTLGPAARPTRTSQVTASSRTGPRGGACTTELLELQAMLKVAAETGHVFNILASSGWAVAMAPPPCGAEVG